MSVPRFLTGTGVFTNTAGLQKLADIIQVGSIFDFLVVSFPGRR
jgi:hypothetical protein